MKKTVFIFSLLFLILGCGKDNSVLDNITTDVFTVQTEKPQKRNIKEEILLSGTVNAKDEAVLYPRISGKLLKNVLKEGDRVKRNQTVALIERDEVGVIYKPAPVPSTINGFIGTMYLDKGANVTTSTAVALIVNLEKVRVKVDMPERYISKIFSGQKAFVKVEAFDEYFEGQVYKISPVADKNTRSFLVEILIKNPNYYLKPGMFALVNIVTENKVGVLSVSKESIVTENGEKIVFVAKNSTSHKKNVITGISDDKFVEIKKGITLKDKVINFGLYGLKDNSKIKSSD